MPRIVKTHEVRRRELLAVASELFSSKGYRHTTIDAIIRKTGVAKGTFYYYFKSKEDILEALARDLVAAMVERARAVAEATNMTALEKTRVLLGNRQLNEPAASTVMEHLHRPEGREVHERINRDTILVFAPVLARIVEQGVAEGSFRVEYPLETVQLLLSGSQFLLDSGFFQWSTEEDQIRRRALQTLVERALDAPPDSMDCIASRLS